METVVVKHDTIYSTKFPQLLSAPSGSIYRWTVRVLFSMGHVYIVFIRRIWRHEYQECHNIACARNQNPCFVNRILLIKFQKPQSLLASVVTVWQKKHDLLTAHFSEDSEGVGIAQSALCLTDRLINQARLLCFHTKSVSSTKRQ